MREIDIRAAARNQELRQVSPVLRQRHAGRRKVIEWLVDKIVEHGAAEWLFDVELRKESARAVLGMGQSIVRWYQPNGMLTPQQIADRYGEIALQTVAATEHSQTAGAT